MKVLVLMGALVFAVTAQAQTDAAEATTEVATPVATEAKPSTSSKKKTTDVSFEDVLVQGKYHFADEAVTTVEQDKILDALLGVRTDFKDRMKKSAARH